MTQYNFKCAKPKHQSQVLFICFDNKCKNNRKCCVRCIDDQHQTHEIVSVQKFMKEVNQNLQRYNDHPQKEQIYKLLDTIRNSFAKTFCSIKSKFMESIGRVESKVDEFINTITEALASNHEQRINSHILNTFTETDAVINEYMNLTKRAKDIQIGTFKELRRKLYDYLYFFEDEGYQLQSQLQKFILNLQKSASTNFLSFTKNNQEFKLSELNKALCIQLDDSKKTLQNLTSAYNYTVCCLDKPFDYANNKVFIKINKNPNKKVWLGACILDVVKKNNFVGCNGIGKGTYAIIQNSGSDPSDFATVSAHHEQKHPISGIINTPKWNFSEGDIILLQFSNLDSYLSFNVINQNYDAQGFFPANQIYLKVHGMTVNVKGRQIYPFVGLSGVGGDQVTILSQSQIEQLIAPFGNKWLQYMGQYDDDYDDEGDLNMEGDW